MVNSLHSIERKNTWLEWIFLIFVVVGYYLWLSTNTIFSASANGRLLDVFIVDEYEHFFIIREALTNHTVCVNWSVYGQFFFNIILFPLYVLQRFSPINDQLIILALRYVSTVSAALTVILTFGLARRYFGRLVAWMSSLLLMVVPFIFNFWSVTSHPDALQMFTVTGSLFAGSEYLLSKKKRWLIISAAFAGFAFSTKYAGLFLLPVIWLVCLRVFEESPSTLKKELSHLPGLLSALRLMLATGVSFLIAFFITSPCLLLDWDFVFGLTRVVGVYTGGFLFEVYYRRTEWLEILSSTSLIGKLNSIILAFALISFFVKTWKTKGGEFRSHKGLLWTWVLYYFAIPFFAVNVREDRYLLVIIPFIFILLASFLADILDYARRKFSGKFASYFVVGVLVVISAVEMWGGFTRQFDLIATRTAREINNPVIEAGEWLERNYESSTRIVYDRYSYIPPKFTRVWGTFNMDATLIEGFRPRVIVINSAIRDIYRDPSAASGYVEGPERYMEMYEFYDAMEQQKHGFVLVAEFGPVTIYERER